MSPLAHFLLAAAALHAACAASLAEPGSKLIAELKPEPEGPLDKDAAPEAVVIEQTSVVEDVNNELRAKPEDIPVEVVVEDSRPAIKTNEVADDDEEIKRPSIDLRNPGPPQRQEHETQNADHFSDAQEKLLTVRETILQTQDLLRQGIQGVTNDISNWLSTNEQMNAIQQNIQSLRDTFTIQIQKLNEVTKGLAGTQALKTDEKEQAQTQPDLSEIEQDQEQSQPGLSEVETRIKNLQNNFNNGVRALSEGVNIVAILRAEDGNAEVAAPATPTNPPGQNILFEYMSNLQTNITNSLNEIASSIPFIGSFINRTTSTLAPGVQADTPEGTTQQPANNIWTNFQLPTGIQNILTGLRPQGQGDSAQNPSAPQGPGTWFLTLQNATQNFFQNGFGRPGTSQATNSGSNATPQNPVDEKHPEPAAAAPTSISAASPATAAPTGPIREILSNSPVVQSIAGTVQRIQSSITNPERPRDTEKNDDLQTKGGFYGGYKPGASGDSDDSRSGLKEQSSDTIKEVISDNTKKPEADKKTPDVVLEKTE